MESSPTSRSVRHKALIAVAVLCGTGFAIILAFLKDGSQGAFGFCLTVGVVAATLGLRFVCQRLAIFGLGYRGPLKPLISFFDVALSRTSVGESTANRAAIRLTGPFIGYAIGFSFLAWDLMTSSMLNEHADTNPHLEFFAFMLFIVNGFLLLPIPLSDGGRILELLIYSRFPLAEILLGTGFLAASAWGVHALNGHWDDIVALLVLFCAPSALKFVLLTRPAEWLRKNGLNDSRLAEQVIADHTAPPAGLIATVALLALYIASLSAPYAAGLAFMRARSADMEIFAKRQREITQLRLSRCKKGDDRWCGYVSHGLFASKDPAQIAFADFVTRRGCDHGNAECCWSTAMVEEKSLDPAIYARSLDDYEKACLGEEKFGCQHVAQLQLAGVRTPRNPAAAVRALHRFCTGDPLSTGCVDLADIDRKGDGVPRDPVLAADLYERLCKPGLSPAWAHIQIHACRSLHEMFAIGDGVPKDDERARKYLHRTFCVMAGDSACPAEWKPVGRL